MLGYLLHCEIINSGAAQCVYYCQYNQGSALRQVFIIFNAINALTDICAALAKEGLR